MYFLGIDIGSSFLKSSVLNLSDRRVEESGSLPTPPFADLPAARREIPVQKGHIKIPGGKCQSERNSHMAASADNYNPV